MAQEPINHRDIFSEAYLTKGFIDYTRCVEEKALIEAIEILQKELEEDPNIGYVLSAGSAASHGYSNVSIEVSTSPFNLKKEIIELAKQVKEKAKHESANEESAEQ